jgi:Heterokaryon incompatibility protein (HET)
MPVRFLDLQCSSIPTTIRLVTSQEGKEHYPYVTLSYKWGSDRRSMMQLTRETLGQMTCSVDTNNLPRIFREAVDATQRLGVRYLWIDALCIVQDDLRELADECAVVDEIYKGSVCSIAAGAGDGNDRLFTERDPQQVRPPSVNIRWQGFAKQARRDDGHSYLDGSFCILESNYREQSILTAPLNKRAWVLQERLLLPRRLQFGRKQVFWDSHRFNACECFPQGYPKPENPMDHGYLKAELAPTKDLDRDATTTYEDDSIPAIQRWNQVIRLYSGCAITKESDNLVAVSGLARDMHAQLNQSTYHASHWSYEMAQSLMWKVKNGRRADGSPSIRPLNSPAPSWSSLSVNGLIEPRDPYNPKHPTYYKPVGKILSCHTPPISSKHPYGDVQMAHMILLGRLYQNRYAYWPVRGMKPGEVGSDAYELDARVFSHGAPLSCTIDDLPAFTSRWNNRICHVPFPFSIIYSIYQAVFKTEVPASTRLIGCLLGWPLIVYMIVRFSNWLFANFGSKDICFLALEESLFRTRGLVLQRNESGTFRRLGVFNTMGSMFAKLGEVEVVVI